MRIFELGRKTRSRLTSGYSVTWSCPNKTEIVCGDHSNPPLGLSRYSSLKTFYLCYLLAHAMPNSRPESLQPSHAGRKRSNTVQSHFNLKLAAPVPPVQAAPPLQQGDSKILTTWVHDIKDSPNVVFNQLYWPGVAEGDIIQIAIHPPGDITSGLLFIVPKDETVKHQLQVYFFVYVRAEEVTGVGRYRFPNLWPKS